MRLILTFLAALLPEVATAQAPPRPAAPPAEIRCSADGVHCIALSRYVDDTCDLIETAAQDAGIDVGFFARLLWQESLFDAAAVSPAGAQGIAQFMPGTAALRQLDDPFNPAKAILASADYLGELIGTFGNEGLAAVAYNAGENRAARFQANGAVGVPGETRVYVRRITGHSAHRWRDDPPGDVDFSLAPGEPFADACRRQASARSIDAFRDPAPAFGVVIASGRQRATVEGFADRLSREKAAALGDRPITFGMRRLPGFGSRPRHVALLGASTRAGAQSLCRELRRSAVFCKVVGP